MAISVSSLRSVKVAEMALFDWVATYLAAYCIWRVGTSKGWFDAEMWQVFLAIVVLGIFVHKVVGINTVLGYYLGLNPKP